MALMRGCLISPSSQDYHGRAETPTRSQLVSELRSLGSYLLTFHIQYPKRAARWVSIWNSGGAAVLVSGVSADSWVGVLRPCGYKWPFQDKTTIIRVLRYVLCSCTVINNSSRKVNSDEDVEVSMQFHSMCGHCSHR